MSREVKIWAEVQATAGREPSIDDLNREAFKIARAKGWYDELGGAVIGSVFGYRDIQRAGQVGPEPGTKNYVDQRDYVQAQTATSNNARAAETGETGAASGPIDLMKPGDQFLRNAANRLDVDPSGVLDVVAHGNPSAVEVHGQIVNHRTLARLIEQDPQFFGQDIRLLSCSTGKQANGFAQNLANKLGVQVTAPSDTLWAFPNGRFTIGPTPSANTGQWMTFKPGGKP